MIPTQISEEVNDDDHETSDQVTTMPRGQPEHVPVIITEISSSDSYTN